MITLKRQPTPITKESFVGWLISTSLSCRDVVDALPILRGICRPRQDALRHSRNEPLAFSAVLPSSIQKTASNRHSVASIASYDDTYRAVRDSEDDANGEKRVALGDVQCEDKIMKKLYVLIDTLKCWLTWRTKEERSLQCVELYNSKEID